MKLHSVSVPPGKRVRLADIDPRRVEGNWTKQTAREQIAGNVQALDNLGFRLYAENRRALLIVLQGMDTAGKDGTIRCAMTGINPQNCHVTSFKQPSTVERSHDFLWRIHRAAPRHGTIGIFNRSHYEDVLVVRVRELVPESEWQTRYERINEFERLLTDGNTTVLKFFLHISKERQLERLRARLSNPDKRWKFNKQAIEERKLWDDYQEAYEAAINKCTTDYAPWHIVPSDRKWYRNLIVSQVIRDTLEAMNPQFPPAEEGIEQIILA